MQQTTTPLKGCEGSNGVSGSEEARREGRSMFPVHSLNDVTLRASVGDSCSTFGKFLVDASRSFQRVLPNTVYYTVQLEGRPAL